MTYEYDSIFLFGSRHHHLVVYNCTTGFYQWLTEVPEVQAVYRNLWSYTVDFYMEGE